MGEEALLRAKRRYGLPPLAYLRAISDARGYTRAQLADRSGLSPPTITRCLEGKERVRPSTAEKLARAVGVPVAALYDDLAFGEVSGRLRLPPVTAGRGYGYPEGAGEPVEGNEPEGGPPQPQPGGRQYVIVHRDEWSRLHGLLSRMSERLDGIEEAVGELATRPIAQFDVEMSIKERGQG